MEVPARTCERFHSMCFGRKRGEGTDSVEASTNETREGHPAERLERPKPLPHGELNRVLRQLRIDETAPVIGNLLTRQTRIWHTFRHFPSIRVIGPPGSPESYSAGSVEGGVAGRVRAFSSSSHMRDSY